LEECEIGGLGILIVKSLMDKYLYERIENENIVRIEKYDVVNDKQ
jgi:anti-sigma regulatory factor (Ser/Thr protein kinase)